MIAAAVPAAASADVLPADATVLLSSTGPLGAMPPPSTRNAFSGALSADGRVAAFVDGLPGEGAAGGPNGIVVRDLRTGAAALASREDGADGAPMQADVFSPQLSADGSRVAFQTSAASEHVFVRDLRAGRTFLVDRADGPEGAPGASAGSAPTISDDGQRVAFLSGSDNLGAGVTGTAQVFVRDLAAGKTTLVSRADAADGAPANGIVENPVISGDGRTIAFQTEATNLGDGDTDATDDVHLRRLETGRTVLASVDGQGVKGDEPSTRPSLSRDGSRVSLVSSAPVFAGSAPGRPQAYVRDLTAGTLDLVSRADGGSGAAIPGPVTEDRLSADGRSVAFTASPTTSIAPGAPADGAVRVYARQLATGATRLISRASGPQGAATTDGAGFLLDAISADGQCVAFTARGDLLPGGNPNVVQVFLRTQSGDCGPPDEPPPPTESTPQPGAPTSAPPVAPPRVGDRTAPRLTAVRLSRLRVRVARTAAGITVRSRWGTVLSLRSSEAARLTITVDRERRGRSTGRKRVCRVTTLRPRRGACVALTRDGTLRRVLPAGSARFALSGRIGTRRLALGRHRLRLVARDAAGNASRPLTLRLTIVR